METYFLKKLLAKTSRHAKSKQRVSHTM